MTFTAGSESYAVSAASSANVTSFRRRGTTSSPAVINVELDGYADKRQAAE